MQCFNKVKQIPEFKKVQVVYITVKQAKNKQTSSKRTPFRWWQLFTTQSHATFSVNLRMKRFLSSQNEKKKKKLLLLSNNGKALETT
jgi:hypothetical protein